MKIGLFIFLIILMKSGSIAFDPLCSIVISCKSPSGSDCGTYDPKTSTNPNSVITFFKNKCKSTNKICNYLNKTCADTGVFYNKYFPFDKPFNSKNCRTSQINATTGLCTGLDEGKICFDSSECAPRLACQVPPSGGKTICTKLPSINETCSNTNTPSCLPFLKCINNKCIQYTNKTELFQTFIPSCTMGSSNLCISNGKLVNETYTMNSYCTYDNGDRILPFCNYNGSVICNYGLSDVPEILDNFYDYINQNISCPYLWPFCLNGMGLKSSAKYNNTINNLFKIFRIKERLADLADCYDQLMLFYRTGGILNQINFKLYRVLDSSSSFEFNDMIMLLSDVYINQNPKEVINQAPPPIPQTISTQSYVLINIIFIFLLII